MAIHNRHDFHVFSALCGSDLCAAAFRTFIQATAADGTLQHVHYHNGVGSDGDFVRKVLGGAIGLGLKKIIQQVYEYIVTDYASGDELYIFGFSRGAYAARACVETLPPIFWECVFGNSGFFWLGNFRRIRAGRKTGPYCFKQPQERAQSLAHRA
jgi:dipeptidyl aminopeptidase/acylaminoacyl peptidase